MKENQIIRASDTDIIVYNPPEVSIEKSRKRRKHDNKRLLFFALILIMISYVGAINYPKIKNHISLLSNSSDTTFLDSEDTSDNVEEVIIQEKEKYTFINTSPTEMKFINESAHQINLDNLSYSLPTSKEIYSSYSDTSPVVLIVHYSPNEAYSTKNGYSEQSSFYSESENVANIGEELCTSLNSKGINALHISNYGYEGSLVNGKELYEEKIRETLKAYPSISYIFDISRDISINSDHSMNKESITLNGVNYPTIKLSCGVNNVSLTKENEKSIFLMNQLSNLINENHPTLVSCQAVTPYTLFNIFNTPMLRVDIGSFASTYNEALLSVNIFADSLADLIIG